MEILFIILLGFVAFALIAGGFLKPVFAPALGRSRHHINRTDLRAIGDQWHKPIPDVYIPDPDMPVRIRQKSGPGFVMIPGPTGVSYRARVTDRSRSGKTVRAKLNRRSGPRGIYRQLTTEVLY